LVFNINFSRKDRLLKVTHNVRAYEQMSCQSDSVFRYTKAQQSDIIRNLMPINWFYTKLTLVTLWLTFVFYQVYLY